MENKEKFLKLVSQEENNTLDKIKERNANRVWLRASQEIAKKVLIRLRELGWTKTKLAQELGVSKQQVSKIVKGRENFTISTIVNLEKVLNISILYKKQETLEVYNTNIYEEKTNILVASDDLSFYDAATKPKYKERNISLNRYYFCKNAV
jgi:transcriptional regulator with XRE-family HTH domain